MDYDKQEYTERIINAVPARLVVINLELIISCLQNNQYKKAQAYLTELMVSLDMKYEISQNLMNIYLYVNKLIINAIYSKKEALKIVNEAEEILSKLLFAWKEIEKKSKNNSIKENITINIYI